MKKNFLISVFIILSFIAGYFTGLAGAEKQTNYLPETINIADVTFSLEKQKLSCSFIPESYSDKFTYKVNVIDSSENSPQICETNITNSQGTVTTYVEDGHTYKFVLIVDNGLETRNIVLANEVFINLEDNTVVVR